MAGIILSLMDLAGSLYPRLVRKYLLSFVKSGFDCYLLMASRSFHSNATYAASEPSCSPHSPNVSLYLFLSLSLSLSFSRARAPLRARDASLNKSCADRCDVRPESRSDALGKFKLAPREEARRVKRPRSDKRRLDGCERVEI